MKPCLAIYMQSRKKEQPSTGIIHSKTGRDLIGQKVAGYRCAKNVCMRVQFRCLDKDKSLRESSLAEAGGKTAPRRSPFIGHERGLCGLLRMKEVEDLLKEV